MAHVYECASNKSVFKEYGGDLLFLMRNVVHTVGFFLRNSEDYRSAQGTSDDIRDDNMVLLRQASQMLSDLMQRWIHEVSLCDMEMHDILNIVEAMHVFKQLQIADDNSVPSVQAIISCLTQKPQYPGISTKKQWWHEAIPMHSCQEQAILPSVSRHSAGDNRSAEPTRVNPSAEPTKARRRRNSSSVRSRTGFNYELVKRHLAEMLIQFDVTDMVGWNPRTKQVPITHPSHCANCGTEHGSGRTSKTVSDREHMTRDATGKDLPYKMNRCTQCHAQLRSRIDYGALTDALVWSYLFDDVDVPLIFNNAQFSFTDIVNLLPLVRNYLRLDELGRDFFQLQCYFVTHFIYVVSDWGRHSLRRELFREEFLFIVQNLPILVHHEDPELVGEFIHCLRIFNVTKQTDPTLWSRIEFAMRFLLGVERSLGSKGTWKKTSSSVYDRYHSSFCGILGLLVYDFHGEPFGNIGEIPISTAFRFSGSSK